MTLVKDNKFSQNRMIGSEGWNNFSDPQDIKSTQVPSVLNMVFDKGYPKPRKGSFLKWSKPEGETNDFLCFIKPNTSDGVEYVIAVYAPNFYLRDEQNDQWIKLNHSYTPSATYKDLMYSFINWNAGRGSDRVYIGNGQENTIKYPVCLDYFDGDQVSADTTITLVDGTRFPSGGGTVVIKEANIAPFTVTYTSRTGNVLTLSGTLGANVGAGAAVACEIDEVPGMAKGKVFGRFQRRLFVANFPGGETTLKYSVTETPEDFTTGSTITAGGALILSDGNGGITSIDDFGEFLAISKADSIHRFSFSINQDLNSKLDKIEPIITDNSIGPISPWSKIKKNGILYFPTEVEGIMSVNPKVTGGQSSTDAQVLSLPIQPYVESVGFMQSRGVAYKQYLHWTVESNTVSDYILVYNLLRGVWSRFNNWDVRDWIVFENNLYYGARISGDIFVCYHDSMTDNNNPYETNFMTKIWDMELVALPKTQALIFVEGIIKPTTNFFIDVLFNDGAQATITFPISGTGKYVNQVISEELGSWLLGTPTMGGDSSDESDDYGIFRVYLNLPMRFGFYNLQLRVRSSVAASDYGITEISHAPLNETQVPQELCIDPV